MAWSSTGRGLVICISQHVLILDLITGTPTLYRGCLSDYPAYSRSSQVLPFLWIGVTTAGFQLSPLEHWPLIKIYGLLRTVDSSAGLHILVAPWDVFRPVLDTYMVLVPVLSSTVNIGSLRLISLVTLSGKSGKSLFPTITKTDSKSVQSGSATSWHVSVALSPGFGISFVTPQWTFWFPRTCL